MYKSTGIEKVYDISRLWDYARQLMTQTLNLLTKIEIMRYFMLFLELYRIVVEFEFV